MSDKPIDHIPLYDLKDDIPHPSYILKTYTLLYLKIIIKDSFSNNVKYKDKNVSHIKDIQIILLTILNILYSMVHQFL